MERTRIVQAVWRGEAVEDPAYAQDAVDIARTELRRRQRMRPFTLIAALFGVVIALTDLFEGTIGPAIALLLLAAACAFQFWRTPRMLERLRRAEERNAAIAGSSQLADRSR